MIEFRKWTARRWFEIVGSNDEKHLRAGTGADSARSVAGAISYLAKYISKEDQTKPGNFTGRYWGVIGKEALPLAEVLASELAIPAMIKIQRWARKLIKVNMENSRWKNFLACKKGKRHLALFGASRADWDRLRSAWHGGGRSLPIFSADSVGWISTRTVPDTFEFGFKPPVKWRMRNHTTVRLLCDASAFWSSIENAISRGLLGKCRSLHPQHFGLNTNPPTTTDGQEIHPRRITRREFIRALRIQESEACEASGAAFPEVAFAVLSTGTGQTRRAQSEGETSGRAGVGSQNQSW